ncbi:MAG TPA: divalent-cation tolerance protein CutA [Burkholderiales bacterium]|nr:divalent-cation tolerance protein CutA [Burkholderiales bacterium]
MDGDASESLLVFTNLPDRDAAMTLAQALVEKRLAACVNVLTGCTSVYRWKGEVERADEVPVLIKTRAARYQELEAAIRELHPYELPEVVAVPIVRGLPDYLDWVAEETAIPIG